MRRIENEGLSSVLTYPDKTGWAILTLGLELSSPLIRQGMQDVLDSLPEEFRSRKRKLPSFFAQSASGFNRMFL
jgi:hypothetical protein